MPSRKIKSRASNRATSKTASSSSKKSNPAEKRRTRKSVKSDLIVEDSSEVEKPETLMEVCDKQSGFRNSSEKESKSPEITKKTAATNAVNRARKRKHETDKPHEEEKSKRLSDREVIDTSVRSSFGKTKRILLSYKDFVLREVGERILTCGEGEQLGHPGRTTTKKPRAIDTLPADKKIAQVTKALVHLQIVYVNCQTRFFHVKIGVAVL
ncbi:hypothetical protein AB6A40_001939 [Gnathostoma spinigerum]|uniref:Uncharacterized protein n=1 Tax=Gnathostoma spinigerum TaxID=75299 RepID=A0ABD6E5D3_9BILA